MRVLCVLAVLLCAFSCKERAGNMETAETILFDEKHIGAIADLVADVEFVALEDTAASFTKEPSQVVVDDGRIYIRDMYTHKIIVFAADGTFLFALDKRGRGPQEYLEIKSFAIDDTSIYCIDNYKNKLMVYDKLSGDFVREMDLPVVASDIYVADNGDFLLTAAPYGGSFSLKQTPHRIFVTDRELEIKERLLPFGEVDDDPIDKRSYFTAGRGDIYFQAGMNDYFYSFSKSDLSGPRVFSVDFGSNRVPDKYRDDYQESLQYRFMHETPFVTDDYIVFDINYDEYFEVFVYDRKSGDWYMNDAHGRHNFILPVKYVEGKTVYSVLTEGLDSYRELVDNGFNRASPEVEQHLANDGNVLVKYRLK